MGKTPLVSVITPALNPQAGFLLDAYHSLCDQECSWEWLIQLDGRQGTLPEAISEDSRVDVAFNGRQLGIAITRNRALARTRAPYVQSLDADDMLLPDSLAPRIAFLKEHPGLAFAFGRSLRRQYNGEVVSDRRPPIGEGLVEPGELERLWRKDGRSPLKYSTILWRRAVLLGAGGWAALSEMEDVAVTLAISLTSFSYYTDVDVVLFRNHPEQVTNSDAYMSDRAVNRRFIHEYLLCARRNRGIPIPPSYRHPPPDASYRVELEKIHSMRRSK
ncbi:MAG: glycosyltransferase [Actinobacteria bacterium]|nr:glycosyltransferase [Actinomycetota bacterium]